eukprot:TRINITY_DN1150_c0_g1_i11.p1 TRINITY_DN1150_c0_g1~~TRINITY_DN1150_c0_g1_i11.p1  ORF type:complete len:194 (-),score=12.20 TRINITY_DN1150_c0_g1_i11:763-1344(-)
MVWAMDSRYTPVPTRTTTRCSSVVSSGEMSLHATQREQCGAGDHSGQSHTTTRCSSVVSSGEMSLHATQREQCGAGDHSGQSHTTTRCFPVGSRAFWGWFQLLSVNYPSCTPSSGSAAPCGYPLGSPHAPCERSVDGRAPRQHVSLLARVSLSGVGVCFLKPTPFNPGLLGLKSPALSYPRGSSALQCATSYQ